MAFGTLNYVILFAYLAIIFYVGTRFAGKQKTTQDLFLADRNVPWLLVGMSMFASQTSAISYMGLPGTAFKENASYVVYGIISITVAPVLIHLFYPFYRRLRLTTSYEYLGKRYGDSARYATSLLFLLARLGWLGVVIYAPAVALSITCGLNLYMSIMVMGIVAIAYTTIGGLAAVIWTDAVQFVILIGGAIWVAVTLVTRIPGGVPHIISLASQANHLGVFDFHFSLTRLTATAVIVGAFSSMLQEWGTDQVAVQRLLAAKNTAGVTKAVLFNCVTEMLVMSLLTFIGVGFFVYYNTFSHTLPQGLESDKILPYYVIHALPAGVSGIVIAGIFAAAMACISAGTNSVVTVLVSDFIKPLRRIERSDQYDLRMARWLTIAVGAVCIGVAFGASTMGQLLKASQSFLGLFASPVLSIFMLGMLTRRANFKGWTVGALLSVVVMSWVQRYTTLHWVYYATASFLISFIAGYVFSLLIPGPLARVELTVWGRRNLKQIEEADTVTEATAESTVVS